MGSPIDAHIAGANTLLGAGTSAISTSSGDAGNYVNGHFNNLAGGLYSGLGVTSAALGQSMGFYYLTRSSSTNTAEAVAAAFRDGVLGNFQWTLANDGSLTYGVSVAAVPEPTTWALFAAGALMLAGMARRRLS